MKKFNNLPQEHWADTDAKCIFTQITEFLMPNGEQMGLLGLKCIWLRSALASQSSSLCICSFLYIINYVPSKLALTLRVIQYFLEQIYKVCTEDSFQSIKQVWTGKQPWNHDIATMQVSSYSWKTDALLSSIFPEGKNLDKAKTKGLY